MISESGKLVTNPRTTCSIDCSSFKAGMMILTSLGVILNPIHNGFCSYGNSTLNRGKVHLEVVAIFSKEPMSTLMVAFIPNTSGASCANVLPQGALTSEPSESMRCTLLG